MQTGRLDRQLSESSIKISWSADGKNRAYWYQLARAALGEIVGEVPMPIPERKDAAKLYAVDILFNLPLHFPYYSIG